MQITGRNLGIWQISQDKNVSTEVPLRMRFFIPPTASGLRNMPLSISITDYETYSRSASSDGDHTHSIVIPNHTHNFSFYEYGPSLDGGKAYLIGLQYTGRGEISYIADKHVTNPIVSAAGGSTEVTTPTSDQHTHDVISELTTHMYDCDTLSLSVDGVNITPDIQSEYGNILDMVPASELGTYYDITDVDVYPYLSTPILNAWHTVEITPQLIGFPDTTVNCYMYAYLSPELKGGGI